MQTIYVKVNKVVNTYPKDPHRIEKDGRGDYEEHTSCKIWTSAPFNLSEKEAQISEYLNFRFREKREQENTYPDWGENYESFMLGWTKLVCEILNYSFYFKEYNYEWEKKHFEPSSKDTEDKCIYEMTFVINNKTLEFYCEFKGQDITNEPPKQFIEYSPFKTIQELRIGIVSLIMTHNPIPDSWLYYLIKNAKEDLSDFFRNHTMHLEGRYIRFCDEKGELYESIKNADCEPVTTFRACRPKISYLEACRIKDKSAISWYQAWGASKNYVEQESNPSHSYCSPDEYYDEVRDDYINDLKAEMNSWEEGWQWNVD